MNNSKIISTTIRLQQFHQVKQWNSAHPDDKIIMSHALATGISIHIDNRIQGMSSVDELIQADYVPLSAKVKLRSMHNLITELSGRVKQLEMQISMEKK